MPRHPQHSPGPDTWRWHADARCRGEDPSIFFHPDGERGRARHNRQERAKRVCRQCPVRVDCHEHSLRFEEPYGIWGGLTEEERSHLLSPRAVNLRTHRAYD
ncbi:WhiB family transcriptional regulator [Mycobacterium sp. AMU20-3851]|uniref:WhiB family transcriptional regulator n=1 Tax=Mycobacterium sp. AMU20-3851 TaxID=3122055 RepID=UPI0037545BE0